MTASSPHPRKAVFVALGIVLVGAVLATAASQHRPGPRLGRKTRLVDLIAAENARARDLRRQLDDLRAQVDALSASRSARTADLDALRRSAESLTAYAGLAPVRGPGLTVEMRDSTLRTAPTGDPNDLVIHEQDIQAVVNALWSGGAEAIAINGQRITGESAIRCVGNTLLLNGSVYSPPYRIDAIGDARTLQDALEDDLLVERFRAAISEFRLGFAVAVAGRLALPAFEGPSIERFARVA